ncbi:2201_t:CDS:2, partial [Acaulospora morrowiae]
RTKRKIELEEDEIPSQNFAFKKARLKPARISQRKRRTRNPYSNQVMHAEEMCEIPCDLEENWYVVLCPVGKRCLVVSAKGKTICRMRNGFVMNAFESNLPAGSSTYSGNKTTDYCILDCIYDQTTSTYYVLDMMCWKGHPIYDCDTEFRFYWLNAKLAEVDAPTRGILTHLFTPLTSYPCNHERLKSLILHNDSFGYRPDGLLFFNKKTHYVLGDTPLCGWVEMKKANDVFSTFLQGH